MQSPASSLTVMWFLSGLIGVLSVVVASDIFSDSYALNQVAKDMEKEREILAKHQRCSALLRAEIAELDHPENVRAVIGNELHWAAEGATIYRFDDRVIDESLRGTPCYGR